MELNFYWSEYGKKPDECSYLREKVFLSEQKFTIDDDDIDLESYHLVVKDGDILAGVARIFTEKDDVYTIGRVAVEKEYRGKGVGNYIMNQAGEKIAQLGAKEMELEAQCHAREFYEKNGFVAYGDVFKDEHCDHIMMNKTLDTEK